MTFEQRHNKHKELEVLYQERDRIELYLTGSTFSSLTMVGNGATIASGFVDVLVNLSSVEPAIRLIVQARLSDIEDAIADLEAELFVP